MIDRNGIKVVNNSLLLFELGDEVELGGYNRYVTDVQLCFWCDITNKYIKLSDMYENGIIDNAKVVRNQINAK